jgi:hypothetical protein
MIVNSAPCGAPKCSRSGGTPFTLPWNPCSPSRGNGVHDCVEYAPATHRSIAVSVAIRVLVVGATILCASGARDRGDSPCPAALDEPSDLNLLRECITVIPQSHVSVSKTADMLLVHVLEGGFVQTA